jgi:lipopolysaccharide export system ATP-binding protein
MRPQLKAISLTKSCRNGRDGVSIEVGTGEVVGLLGPNGAGKTTTFSMIIGLVPQDEGRIYLGDEDISDMPMYLRAQKGVSLLPQEPSAFRKLSVEDNLLSILEVMPESMTRGDGDVGKVLREFGLDKLARAKASSLSGGERRRL